MHCGLVHFVVQWAQPPFGQPRCGHITAQFGFSQSNAHSDVSRPEQRVSHVGGSHTGEQTSSHSGLVHDHLHIGVQSLCDSFRVVAWVVAGAATGLPVSMFPAAGMVSGIVLLGAGTVAVATGTVPAVTRFKFLAVTCTTSVLSVPFTFIGRTGTEL